MEVALLPDNADQLPDLLGFLWECGGSCRGTSAHFVHPCSGTGDGRYGRSIDALLRRSLNGWKTKQTCWMPCSYYSKASKALQGGNATAEEEMLKLMLAELMQRERA